MEPATTPTQKTCTRCQTEKPLTDFSRKSSSKDGHRSHCRECMAEYRAANRDKLRTLDAERHARLRNRADHEIEYPTEKKCSQCGDTKPASEFTKNRTNLDGLQNNCKLCARWEQVRHKYGLSRDGWEAMWETQGGRCVICQEPMKRDGVARDSLRAVIDHCHGGGQVRALLHSECNRILGFFQDDPAVFRRAARYLELGAGGPVDVARLDADISPASSLVSPSV